MSKVEIWKDIPNYEGLYQVSNLGRVKSKRGKIKATFNNHSGYERARLYKGGKGLNHSIHRLVLLAFVGESDLQVNHKDSNKSNNHLDNLEYCTASENIRHAVKSGTFKGPQGEKQHKSKLTLNQVKKIKYAHADISIREIAEMYGVDPSTIYLIRKGVNWKHV